MARYITSIRTPRSNVDAFEYMADLKNFEQWDPGVRRVTQVAGDGAGSSASFDVVVDAPGRGLTLRYHTTHFDPPREGSRLKRLLSQFSNASTARSHGPGCSI